MTALHHLILNPLLPQALNFTDTQTSFLHSNRGLKQASIESVASLSPQEQISTYFIKKSSIIGRSCEKQIIT